MVGLPTSITVNGGGANKYPVEGADKVKTERDVKAAAKLGEITVEAFRVKIGPDKQFGGYVAKDVASEISEKAIKGRALSHGTT